MSVRRLRIVHRTTIRYGSVVAASHNEVRVTPRTEPGQTTLESRLEVRPMTWSHVYWDYWGSQVTAFEVLTPHDELHIEARSTVEREERPVETGSVGWADLARPDVRDRWCELLALGPRTDPGPELAELARSSAAGLGPGDAAVRICERLREQMRYEQGSTGVHTRAEDAWRERRGVCQDFAHLAIGALRTLGIPTRYVSGYLQPAQGADVGQTARGESHAWIEWWDGGWQMFDPTNGGTAGVDHVVVSRGRDYDDVPPFKGVYSGSSGSTMDVVVEVTRLG